MPSIWFKRAKLKLLFVIGIYSTKITMLYYREAFLVCVYYTHWSVYVMIERGAKTGQRLCVLECSSFNISGNILFIYLLFCSVLVFRRHSFSPFVHNKQSKVWILGACKRYQANTWSYFGFHFISFVCLNSLKTFTEKLNG